jgi:hypothetical protein
LGRPHRGAIAYPLGLGCEHAPRLYGRIYVLVGGLVLGGVITSSGPVDEHGLRWHVFVWDIWFLLWGLALGLATWRSQVDRATRDP